MDEHRCAVRRADARPDLRAISCRVARPLDRLNGGDRYREISGAVFPSTALVDELDVEIDIAEAHQSSRNRLSGGRDDGDEIAGRKLVPQFLE